MDKNKFNIQNNIKKLRFRQYDDILRKKRLFQSIPKKTCFFPEILIFTYGQKTTFSKCSKKKRYFPRNIDIYRLMNRKRFFEIDLKKCALPRNVDIYGHLDKNDFFKMISKNVRYLKMMILTD